MNRRDFLKSAGAAIVPAAIPGAIWSAEPPVANAARLKAGSPAVVPITAVIYDERYVDCKLFADALVRQGAVAFPANGDSAQLWYGQLREHLARYPGRVAGLTTYADFTISQACGRELSYVALYEGAHDARRSRTNLTHRLCASSDAREITAAFDDAGAPWAESLAAALAQIPLVDRSARRAKFSATTPRSAGHPGYLASWMLAPPAPVS